jgi:hypothetical protein
MRELISKILFEHFMANQTGNIITVVDARWKAMPYSVRFVGIWEYNRETQCLKLT